MKKFPLIILMLIVTSCHSQDKDKKEKNGENSLKPIKLEIPINPLTMQNYTTEKFDIDNYFKNRNKTVGSYEYISSDGVSVMEMDIEGNSFYKVMTPKYSIFTSHKEYYKSGSLKNSWQTFLNDGFIKGNKYEYDLKGKLIKVEDWDKPFTFTWEQVKKYIEQDLKLNILKDKVGVGNDLEYPDYNFPTWSISYIGKYKDDPRGGLIRIMLNGTTGELLLVERQIGKGGEGTTVDTLYEKKK